MFNVTHYGAVPQISIDGQMIIGFNESLLKQKLGIGTTTPAATATVIPAPTTTLPPSTLVVAPPPPATVPAGNLAPNCSFENGSTVPDGWVSQVRNTDATLSWLPDSGYNVGHAVGITASTPGNQGWPGWETAAAIPIDPAKKYEFKTYYYVPDVGILWMDIQLINSQGKVMGWTSTSTNTALPQSNTWLVHTLTFDPGTLSNTFPDIASVKLGLRLCLNWEIAKLPTTTIGTIYFDIVSFAPIGTSDNPRPPAPPFTIPAPATTRPPSTSQVPTPVNISAPVLLSPSDGSVLDNGRFDGRDNIIWDFDWSDIQEASQYQLYVISSSSSSPVINTQLKSSSYHWVNNGTIGGESVDQYRFGWIWKVRALINGIWSGWSLRTFNVEPVDTDPPVES